MVRIDSSSRPRLIPATVKLDQEVVKEDNREEEVEAVVLKEALVEAL